MFGFLFKAPALQLVLQADVMTKFVLFCLFLLSVLCISIALGKFWTFWMQKRSIKQFNKKLKAVRTFDELLQLGKEYRHFLAGTFLLKSLNELKEILEVEKKTTGKDVLSAEGLEHLQLLSEQVLDQVLSEQEQYLPVLGTSAAVAPLIGLFGTVWGLVHAFVDISQQKSADISVVAPGIAEALTTTLAGLIVAIPAVIFFHYFSNELRKVEQQLWIVSDKFLNIVKKTFI